MKQKLLLAVVIGLFGVMPAFASVQNIKVSGDIDSTYLIRDAFDFGINTGDSFNQHLLVTQTRLRFDTDLTDNVSATISLINERTWNEEDATSTDIDLNLAFVELREFLYSPLTVRVGRQYFAFGNSFVMDSNGANNVISGGNGLTSVADLTKRTALDTVRFTFDYNPITVDLIAAKVDSNVNTGIGDKKDDVDLFGINANYQLGDDFGTVVETYFFSKIDHTSQSNVGSGPGSKADTVYMPGVRVSTNITEGLNMQGELAWQGGRKASTADPSLASRVDNISRNALGVQLIANYALPFEETAKWSPVFTTTYTYLSGDNDPYGAKSTKDDVYTAWDPMFENQSGGTIYNTLFDFTNAHLFLVSGQFKPMEDVKAKLSWTNLWLDKNISDGGTTGVCTGTACFNMRQPDGTIIQPVVTTNSKVGQEFDINLTYDYTEDVQLGLNLGWFFPGDFFHGSNDETAKQALANVSVVF